MTADRLALPLAKNVDGEHLTCFVCSRGENERFPAPEWLVTVRGNGRTVTMGLHEDCRQRSHKP